MNIAVVGAGYVGLVTAVCFAEKGHRVTLVEIDRGKIRALRRGKSPIYEPGLEAAMRSAVAAGFLTFTTDMDAGVRDAEVVFLTVGTPPKPEGGADLSFLHRAAADIGKALRRYTVIVEKSTVPVATGASLARILERNIPVRTRGERLFDIVSNPEFLREGQAIGDSRRPDRVVIGVDSPRAEAVLQRLYRDFHAPLLVTSMKSAELIKHASNSFLALKISYINAVSRICELAGADVREVAEGMGLDRRIGRAFLDAGIGYGGSCFPKDVAAFAHAARELGYDFRLLREVERINRGQRRHALRKITRAAGGTLKGRTIAVLGLAFKPGTDDIRESPVLEILPELLRAGARVRAYDPRAMANVKRLLPRVRYARNAYDAVKGARVLFIATEWDEFTKLDLGRVKRLMRAPVIVDGRNCLEPEAVRKQGFVYLGIGR
ncbi:MAG: UDP-glucose/GDP-mannose dehydrogenase family protein [Planctomycetota bacterium]